MAAWFQTWDRPEYKEWAIAIPEGYLLLILRKERQQYLCAKAKLLMGKSGLPGVEVLEQIHLSNKKEAMEQISLWKTLL